MSDPRGAFLRFKPPGPVAAAFLQDKTHLVRALRGPVGGGKTVTAIFDHLLNSSAMPVCRDGMIHFRVAVIGLTYGQLERNLYRTWEQWLPRDGRDQAGNRWTEAEFTGGGGRYATHQLKWRVPYPGAGPSGVVVNFEAIFAAIGEQSVEQFMRGFEPTAFWLFEMDQLPEAVLSTAITRLGRYPRRADVADDKPYRSYVIGDLNAPDVDSWFYRTFEEDLPSGFKQYVQPSGLSPQAENRANLPPDYYERQVDMLKSKPNLIKRFVLNQYAPSSHGRPVYPEYSDALHLASGDLAPIKGLPILLGVDAGFAAPAAVFVQRTTAGQWRVLGEVCPEKIGTKNFALLIKQTLGEIAPGFAVQMAYADPWGFAGSEKAEDGQLAWAETLQRELGVPVLPAPSNELSLRLDAVRDELNANVDGAPALIVSRRCKVLRKGMASHYCYQMPKQADRALPPKPDKGNGYSDVQDALQYVMLGVKGRYGTIAGRAGATRDPAAAPKRLKANVRLFA